VFLYFVSFLFFFFFKQKTAYEIGLGIPAEPLFRSWKALNLREQFSGFNRTLDAINNVFRKFSAFHDETGRLNVDGMNIISNDGRSEERRVGKECRYRWSTYHKKKKKENKTEA